MKVTIGMKVPPLTIAAVDPARMKTMAAILRDPYPIHWDRAAVVAAGLGDRTVNQGPLNVGYIANMLMAWAGDGSIRRLTVSFQARVFAGDRVTATGTVIDLATVGDEQRATCQVALERGETTVASGTAVVGIASV